MKNMSTQTGWQPAESNKKVEEPPFEDVNATNLDAVGGKSRKENKCTMTEYKMGPILIGGDEVDDSEEDEAIAGGGENRSGRLRQKSKSGRTGRVRSRSKISATRRGERGVKEGSVTPAGDADTGDKTSESSRSSTPKDTQRRKRRRRSIEVENETDDDEVQNILKSFDNDNIGDKQGGATSKIRPASKGGRRKSAKPSHSKSSAVVHRGGEDVGYAFVAADHQLKEKYINDIEALVCNIKSYIKWENETIQNNELQEGGKNNSETPGEDAKQHEGAKSKHKEETQTGWQKGKHNTKAGGIGPKRVSSGHKSFVQNEETDTSSVERSQPPSRERRSRKTSSERRRNNKQEKQENVRVVSLSRVGVARPIQMAQSSSTSCGLQRVPLVTDTMVR